MLPALLRAAAALGGAGAYKDQSPYLIDWDAVFGDITAENLGNQVGANFL
jgi:hypothetical protein